MVVEFRVPELWGCSRGLGLLLGLGIVDCSRALGLFSGLGIVTQVGIVTQALGSETINRIKNSKRSLLTDVISSCSDLFFALKQINFKLASLKTIWILEILTRDPVNIRKPENGRVLWFPTNLEFFRRTLPFFPFLNLDGSCRLIPSKLEARGTYHLTLFSFWLGPAD